MDYLEIDKLEQNIKKAIGLIQKLLEENQRLKNENEELSKRIKEQQDRLQQHNKIPRLGEADEPQAQIYKEKEGKIKQKLQQMLEKIEAFQHIQMNG